jgi:hypothetical protein
MDQIEKVAVLDNEVQAQLVDSLLSERGIPHAMRSYHDSAYDGLFQGGMGWGHVEAPRDYHETVLAIIEQVRREPESPGTAADGGAQGEN